MFRVEHDADGDWISAVREDLYDGYNDKVLELPAVFETISEAEAFIDTIRGLMHMGGGDTQFRIVNGE